MSQVLLIRTQLHLPEGIVGETLERLFKVVEPIDVEWIVPRLG